jgi:hypothetical protein
MWPQETIDSHVGHFEVLEDIAMVHGLNPRESFMPPSARFLSKCFMFSRREESRGSNGRTGEKLLEIVSSQPMVLADAKSLTDMRSLWTLVWTLLSIPRLPQLNFSGRYEP